MANVDIRNYAGEKGVKLWQVAMAMDMHDSNFSRKLRVELSQEEKQKIKDIIDSLSSNKADITQNVICPFCGEEVLNRRFCSECGEMLRESEE